MANITKSCVEGLKCQAVPYVKWYNKVPGFSVKVSAKKKQNKCTKSTLLRYSNVVGTRRALTLSTSGPMTPTQARERAERLVVAIREGVDPVAGEKARGVTL